MIYQGSRFQNLMSSYSDSLTLYQGALDSAGTTQSKYNIWLGGTEAHINQLKATGEGLWLKIFDSKDIQNGIDLINGLVSGLDKLVSGFGAIPSIVGVAMGSLAMFKEKARIIDLKPSFTTDNKVDWKNTQVVWNPVIKQGYDSLKNALSDVRQRYSALTQSYQTGINLQGNVIPSTLQKMSMGFKALTTSTLSQVVAMGALKVGMLALNIASGILIGVLVSVAVQGILKLANASKIAEQSVAELLESFKHAVQDNNNSIQTLSSMSKEYERLTSTINKTADEKTRIHELDKQIAQISPEVVKGYDNEGNAILELRSGVRGLIEDLQEKNRLENAKLVDSGEGAFKTYIKNTKEAQTQLAKLKREQSDESNMVKIGTTKTNIGKAVVDVDQYKSLKQLRTEYNSLSEDEQKKPFGIALNDNIHKAENSAKNLSSSMQVAKGKIDESKQALMPFVQAILNSDEAYTKLDSTTKQLVQDQVQIMDLTKFNNWNELSLAVRNLAVSMDNPAVQDGVQKIGALKDEFNKGTISAEDFRQKSIAVLIELAKHIDGMTPDKLAKIFKIDIDEPIAKSKSFADVMQEVVDSASDVEKEMEMVNKVLDKHAESGEWDYKTLMKLTESNIDLINVLGEDGKMTDWLTSKKKELANSATSRIQAEINASAENLKAYGINVSDCASAEEAKNGIVRDAVNKRIEMYNQELTKINQVASSLAEDDIRGENRVISKMAQVYKQIDFVKTDISVNVDNYFKLKGALSSLGNLYSNVGTSGYDGSKGSSGSSATSERDKAISEANSRLESLRNHLSQAIRKKNEEDKKNALENLKEEEDARVKYYTGRIKDLQDELNSLQDTTQDENEKLGKLKKELEAWSKDDSSYADIKKKELQKQIDDLEKQLKIKDLENKIKTEQINQEWELTGKENEDSFENRRNKITSDYDKLLEDKTIYAQADTLITSNAQQEILNLLLSFAPSYSETGSLLGKSMSDAMLDEVRKGIEAMNNLKSGNFPSSSTSSGSSGGGGSSSTDGNIAWDGKYYRFGSTGETVKRIQKNLGITADGIWGNQTDKAVRDFQRNNGLTVDAIIGKDTWKKLIKFDTGGVPLNEGLAFVHGKERILNADQTKIFDDFVYRLLPQIAKNSSADGFSKNIKNIFNAPVIQNDIKINNASEWDMNNNFDNLNKAIKQELRTSGYRLNLV